MKSRVVIGMSGGVDSSVAARRLLEDGHDVIGITMKLWPQACASVAPDKCCGPEAVADARAVAQQLGIPHYVVEAQQQFQRWVIDHFIAEYRAGRTPSPCVLCNEKLKFGTLLETARSLGASHVATGHYARVERNGGRWRLRKGCDAQKDQSYFLFSLSQEQLAHALFPMGGMTKRQTRAMAAQLGLKVAGKRESQEICFVTDDYRRFLRDAGVREHAGEIVDTAGRVLGEHEGVEFFTIGQRRGLRVAAGRPLYVVAIDPARNRIVVGDDDDLVCGEFVADDGNWVSIEPLRAPRGATVKIRSRHEAVPAQIEPLEANAGRVRVRFAQPQRAVTPGQAAVFYDGDTVLGGGWICR
ncbi:MAG: tRNA 2-thiouridine(34) synthase MnmA [Verrucomicrobiae bacterium]|nr:tRNA 2-thiouridine(34) synthase MnmA [Verrucomicrobiae bacterium]